MIEYAKINEVRAVIILQEIYLIKQSYCKGKNIVKNAIFSNPEIDFIYLKGNHDEMDFMEEEEKPENFKGF